MPLVSFAPLGRRRERLADKNPHDDIRIIKRPVLGLIRGDSLLLRLILVAIDTDPPLQCGSQLRFERVETWL